jgi:hypothetical protein
MEDWLAEKGRMYDLARKYARRVEEQEPLLGASFHLFGVGKPHSGARPSVSSI